MTRSIDNKDEGTRRLRDPGSLRSDGSKNSRSDIDDSAAAERTKMTDEDYTNAEESFPQPCPGQDQPHLEPNGGWRVRSMADYERYIVTMHSLCDDWEAGRISCEEFDRLDDVLGEEADQTTLAELQSCDHEVSGAARQLRDRFKLASRRHSEVLTAVFVLLNQPISGDDAGLVHRATLKAVKATEIPPSYRFKPSL